MPFRARLKRVFNSDQLDTEPAQQRVTGSASSETTQISALPAVDTTSFPTAQSQTILEGPPLVIQAKKTIPEQLWEAGYARLKDRDSKLVQEYETITKVSGTPSVESLTTKLENIEKLTVSRSKLTNIDYVLKLKSAVAAGLQTSWEASLAWAVVCTILEPLLNIGREVVANRDGLLYIIERLEFNNKLSTLRLDSGGSSNIREDLQGEIRLRIITLYMKILHYLIQSSLYHKQSVVKTWAKDSLKGNDWGQLLEDVKSAEAAVDKDDALRKAEENTANLQVLTNIVRSQEDKECLRQLRVTDPRDDKKRIQRDKGGLLQDAYVWILDNDDYKAWSRHIPDSSDVKQNSILWIRGDPGKGKTMLLCGIIDELSKNDKTLAFFFCQATDPRINSAESVVRGLLYMLADKDPTSKVLPILRDKFDNAGTNAFNDTNAWIVVKELFEQTLEALSEQRIWLVVDALDECNQRDRLLDLIDDAPKHVKWLVSSRNWDDIEERFDIILQGQGGLSLELNANSVAKAVNTFIDMKVSNLAKLKKLNKTTIDSVQKYLSINANGTFLWVALVCQSLSGGHCTRFNILELVKKFPQGLDAMYRRIFEQIEDAHEVELIKRILSIAITVFRPLSLAELGHLLPDTTNDSDYLEHMINRSGFLTSQSSEVAFLHLSAKEFLLKSFELMVEGNSPHQFIYQRSMEILSINLKRNLYAMAKVGCHVDDLLRLDHDPLVGIAYFCLYWTHHLLKLWPTCSDIQMRANNERMLRNFYLKKYLYWIEALIWLKSIPHSVHAMINLKQLFSQSSVAKLDHQPQGETADLHRDALRFILSAINVQWYPLQVYASTLYFSPTCSPIRKAFESDMPSWLKSKHEVESLWPQKAIHFRTESYVTRIILSPNGQKLVIVGSDNSEIRSAITGTIELVLAAKRGGDAVFTADSRFVIIATDQGEIQKYDCSTGRLVKEVVRTQSSRYIFSVCVAYTPEGPCVVHSLDWCLHFRDDELNLLRELDFGKRILNFVLSPDASRLAIATGSSVHLYDTKSSTALWTKDFSPFSFSSLPIVFTVDGSNLIGATNKIVYYWNTETGDEESRFTESASLSSFIFFGDDLYYLCGNGAIIRRSQSEVHTYSLRENYRVTDSFAITPYWLVSLNFAYLSFYDLEETIVSNSTQMNKDLLKSTSIISPNCKYVAHPLSNGMIRLWHMALSWQDIYPFPGPPQSDFTEVDATNVIASFSYDDRLAISRNDGKIALWNIRESPTLLLSFIGPTTTDYCRVTFSLDGSYACYSMKCPQVMITKKDFSTLTLNSHGNEVKEVCIWGGVCAAMLGKNEDHHDWQIKVWSTDGVGHLLHCLTSPSFSFGVLSFNDDGSQLGYVTYNDGLRVIDTVSGQVLETVGFSTRVQPYLSYSEKTGHFRTQRSLIYPADKSMELFVDTSLDVDKDIILRLPVEYHDPHARICGNIVTHVLSDNRISMLEIDIEEAICNETTRGIKAVTRVTKYSSKPLPSI